MDINNNISHDYSNRTSYLIRRYTLLWSIAFIVAVPIACHHSGIGSQMWQNFFYILTSPSKLITDYFRLGGLASTLLNAGLCGLSCDFFIWIFGGRASAKTLAGYFLVIAHCFYGLNILNMWPPFFGVLIYCIVCKQSIADNLHIAMLSTSLGPFVSEFLFRYTVNKEFVVGSPEVTLHGIALTIVFALAVGFIVPALLPSTSKLHRGYNLYKAGLAIGLLGCFIYALMFETFGIEGTEAIFRDNEIYEQNNMSYATFMNTFFSTMFLLSIIIGWILNGKSFDSYKALLKHDGYEVDFTHKFGMPACMINYGIYGFCILIYLNWIFVMMEGVGYTGPTAGVTIAALAFAASGQHPRNVWPIVGGYMLLYTFVILACRLSGADIPWTLSSQGYINGLAFATGLCPFVGRYGRRVGIIAGVLDAILCTSTAEMHGGFVLYNGGFTAGLTAVVLLPVLEFYHIKEKEIPSD